MYQPVELALPAKFLTTQSAGNILATVPSSNSFATRFALGKAAVHNRSASAAVVGIGGRIPIALWKAGQWTDATTTYTDDTTDAQDAGADFALGATSTNNDGFIVLCKIPFNIMSIVTSTAASGGAPAWDVSYSLAGGTWSAAVTNLFVAPDFSPAAGEQVVMWAPWNNWGVTEAGHATGIDTGYYGLRIRSTTAGSVSAGVATLLMLGRMFYATEAISDNAVANIISNPEFPLPAQCDAICAAISVVNPQNRATVEYRMRG